MGRKRIQSLLAQLEENQQRQLEVDAAIFAVAQMAVNELGDRADALLKSIQDAK